MAESSKVTYGSLLRQNSKVRRLWFAQVVSELGDWLNLVALLQLIHKFSPSAQAEGFLIILQMMPMVIFSPIAGMVADRFDRRKVMIIADLIRAGLVLGFLTIDNSNKLWLLYLLSALQFSLTSFFEPARAALLPTIAEGEELVMANSLTGVTWSLMLAVGGAVGGIITGLFSARTAFLVDTSSFCLSALLLLGLKTVIAPLERDEYGRERRPSSSLWPVLIYLKENPRVLAVLLVKTGICATAGGVWLLSIIYGQQIFPIGKQGAISVGLLYGAHGLGAVIGASLTSRFFRGNNLNPLRGILWAFLLRGIFFMLWGVSPNIIFAALAIMSVTACGSLLWVMSTTLLQQLTEDSIRGRLFALENAALTLAMAASIGLTGYALDIWHIKPYQATYATAAIAVIIGIGWLLVTSWWPRWQR